MRFTKGKHAFVVATHTDRQHIHNHVIFNSTALDGTRKFRDFFFSALAVQRLSDLICLEHQLSVIEKKPYRERQKRIVYPPKESNRDRLCGIIDTILAEKPAEAVVASTNILTNNTTIFFIFFTIKVVLFILAKLRPNYKFRF